MSRYRRSQTKGGTYFFTVALANRRDRLLIGRVVELRRVYGKVQKDAPFETLAMCVLPDHLHAIWRLPEGDSAFSGRWSLIIDPARISLHAAYWT
jgi:putative transposase